MTGAATTRDGLIQSGIGFGARSITQLSLLGVTIFAIHSLAIADFGAYAIAAAFMFLFRRLFYVGPYEHMLQSAGSDVLNGSCLMANVVFAVGSTVILVLVSFFSRALFETELVGDLLRAMAPALFLTMLTAWFEAYLLRKQKITPYYVYSVASELVSGAAAVWALVVGFGVYSLVIQTYVRLAMLLVCYVVSIRERIYTGHDMGETFYIIRWSRSRYATVFVNFFSVYGSEIMLGALLSPTATGLFRAGNRIVSALTDLFAQPLQKIAQTNLSARTAHGVSVDQSWLHMFSAVGAIGWACLAGLACIASDLVPAVLGAHWVAVTPIVIVMCIVRGLPILDATTVSMLVCGQRRGFILHVQIATAIAVVLGAAASASFGPLAVAFVLGLALMAQSCALCWACCRMSGVDARGLLQALATALAPAIGVVIAAKTFNAVWAPDGSHWVVIVETVIVGTLGGVIGMVLVSGDLLRSARLLAPYRPVEA